MIDQDHNKSQSACKSLLRKMTNLTPLWTNFYESPTLCWAPNIISQHVLLASESPAHALLPCGVRCSRKRPEQSPLCRLKTVLHWRKVTRSSLQSEQEPRFVQKKKKEPCFVLLFRARVMDWAILDRGDTRYAGAMMKILSP